MSGSVHEGVVIVVQARFGSSRLRGKSLKLALGQPLIVHLLDRLLLAKLPIILAVPTCDGSLFTQVLEEYFYAYYAQYGKKVEQGIRARLVLFQGQEHDVLGRFVQALQVLSPLHTNHTVVRVTGDNPFSSLYLLLTLLSNHLREGCDISYYEGLPYGTGVEVMATPALKRAGVEAFREDEREHVTPYLYHHPELFTTKVFKVPQEYHSPALRLTVDTEVDFVRFRHHLKCYAQAKQTSSCSPPLRAVIPLKALIAGERNKHETI